MPTQAEHTAQAKHTRTVLATLPEAAYDWRLTMMMYTALHGLNAFFVKEDPSFDSKGAHYGSYQDKLQKMRRVEMSAEFMSLVNAAQEARYECRSEQRLKKLLELNEPKFDRLMSRLFQLGIDARI